MLHYQVLRNYFYFARGVIVPLLHTRHILSETKWCFGRKDSVDSNLFPKHLNKIGILKLE